MSKETIVIDGNEAAARIAYKLSDVVAIYPITPSSPMGELADQWAARGEKNIFDTIPQIEELQSEAGVSGALHGALQTGSLASTFTASQGLLLMMPNMYKIAGELTPAVFHIAARSLAAQALSIFGDHQDVMAVRSTGFALLASSNPQEAHDMALIAHLSSLESRIPFLHFFDGFRTSHELNKVEIINDEVIKNLLNEDLIIEHRKRALNPENPFIRGTAQNPDVYFQGRESVNKFYDETPDIVSKYMEGLAGFTGRKYKLFDYYGHKEAEKIVLLMTSGTDAVKEYIEQSKEKIGVIQVRLYRPFSVKHFLKVLPKTVNKIAVLDRTKEPGAIGEPLYQDIVTALRENEINIKVVGGRYGLSSKEFTPTMVKAVFENLNKSNPKNHFTIGINDDVTNTSLSYDSDFQLDNDYKTSVFFGLGSDGTVGANKNTIKIIGEKPEYFAQGYFVYDSKKAGSVTESHLRFGKKPIHSSYLIQEADFIACHQFSFLHKIDICSKLKENGTLLLNTHFSEKEVWQRLPKIVQEKILEKQAKLYIIDAYEIAKQVGLGGRINTIMQVCFFEIANVMDKNEAVQKIKDAIKKTYKNKGEKIIDLNIQAVDKTLENLHEVKYSKEINSQIDMLQQISKDAPEFIRNVTGKILEGKGNDIPVSAMPCDGTFPSGTAKYEKNGISDKIAIWKSDACVQCGTCVFACPHSAIRAKVFDSKKLKDAPETFETCPLRTDKTGDRSYTIQISPEDCTGCGLCVKACPLQKAIFMDDKKPVLSDQNKCNSFFNGLDNKLDDSLYSTSVRSVQFKEPLFEFSGACVGCGEIPYVKLITQLFGDRMLVANATGCSSIFGGNLPTTPWAKDKNNRGPAWSNSLFEDNAEFGYGFKISQEKQKAYAIELLKKLESKIGKDLVNEVLDCKQENDKEIESQRNRLEKIKADLSKIKNSDSKHLLSVIDTLINRSVWIIGGDGWAYDIGFGGLDHVIASGKNVNILVMDTEVYSNTGGQSSKATPRGAVAKFASDGKKTGKKDLGAIAMTYKNVYVAQIAIRANAAQALKAIKEAEAYNGPSLIIAYSSCVAHGIDLSKDSVDQQKKAVESGYWPLYRFNPDLDTSFKLDSKEPSIEIEDYLFMQNRFKILQKNNPKEAGRLLECLKKDIADKWKNIKS